MLSFDSKQNLVDFPTLKKDKKNKRFLLLWLKSLKSAANLDDEHNHKIQRGSQLARTAKTDSCPFDNVRVQTKKNRPEGIQDAKYSNEFRNF